MEENAGYQDFTIATAFERFVASIESCVATWATSGGTEGQQRLQAQLRHRLPWRVEPYTLVLHLPPAVPPLPVLPQVEPLQPQGRSSAAPWPLVNAAELRDAPHRLQQWFGVGPFLLLTPDSYSGRVLEEEEVHTLLSAAAVALSHARIAWPLLLPVHDAVRDGYRGVAVAAPSAGGATLHFDTDSLHSSRLSPGLLQLDQQLLQFARQLGAARAPAAAAACRAAAGAALEPAPASMAADAVAAGARGCGPAGGSGGGGGGDGQHVALAVRHCYALPDPGDSVDAEGGSGLGEEQAGAAGGGGAEWDEQAPWRPWAAQADPVGCLELDVVWHFPSAAAAVHAHAEVAELAGGDGAGMPDGLAPADAARWRLLALSTSYERDSGHRGFVLRPVDKPRRFLQLQSLAAPRAQRILAGSAEVAPDQLPGDSSFYGMLLKLLESCRWAAQAPDLGSMASAEWWLRQGAYQPPLAPDWVLQEATRDILQMPVLPVWPAFPPGSVAWPTSIAGQHGRLGKAAPLGALISRFALHALALGSPRSVAELWSRFVGTLRLQYWEPLQPLPRMRLGKQGQAAREQQQQREQPGEQQQQREQPGEQQGGGDGGGAAAGACAGTGAGGSACGDDAQSSQLAAGSEGGGRPEAPDLALSLLHQKLQLLDLCIHLLTWRQQEERGRERQQEQQQGSSQQQRTQGPAPAQQAKAAEEAATPGAAPAGADADGWSWGSSDEMEVDEGAEGQRQQQQQQQRRPAVSPSSSSSSGGSSYFSAGGGSEAGPSPSMSLSPAKSQQQGEEQQQQPAEEGQGQGQKGVPAAAPAAGAAAGAAAAAAASERSQQPDEASRGMPAVPASASEAAAAAAAAAEERPQGVVGVLPGACLHLHPDRPLRLPAVQDPPVQTEDLLAEQQAAMQALPALPGQDASALRAQLQGRMLLSDMQAFKAANPGCCLLDFVRWHSPKDCTQAADGSWHLSKRMAAEGNAWQQLWAAAAPVPAAQQRPLLDPELEGERALHFLETLPPSALFSELLAVGYSAAVQVLRTAGPAAELPAVRRQLSCLLAEAGPELAHGVAAAAAAASAAADSPLAANGGGSRGRGLGGAAAPAATAAEAAAPAAAEPARQQAAEGGRGAVEAEAEAEGWEWEEERLEGGGGIGAEGTGDEGAREAAAEEEEEDHPIEEGDEGSNEDGWLGGPARDPRRQRWPQRQPSWLRSIFSAGLSTSRYRRLLLLLGSSEQTVVAAHSLLLRLGPAPAPALAALPQQQRWRGRGDGISGGGSSGLRGSDFAAASADALIATALGEEADRGQGQGQQHTAAAEALAAVAPAAVVDLPRAHWPTAEALLVQRWADEEVADSAASSAGGSDAGSPCEWPAPFQREWLLQVHPVHLPASEPSAGRSSGSDGGAGGGVATAGGAAAAVPLGGGLGAGLPVLQRMYVKALPSEVRIATSLCAEPCGR